MVCLLPCRWPFPGAGRMLIRLRSLLVRRRVRRIVAVLLLGFVALNGLAFMHAWSMTHFAAPRDGERINAGRVAAMPWWRKARMLVTGVDVPRPTNRTSPAAAGLAFSTHHFRTADGADIEAWRIERADTDVPARGVVILFHGYGGVKSWQIPEAQSFGRMGFDTLLVDFRGGGGSQGNRTTIGYRESLDVVAAVAYARQHLLSSPPRRVVLFGTSMGAAAILRAVAVDHVDVDALILECPFDRLLTTIRNRFTAFGAPNVCAAPLARLLMFWGGVQQGYWTFDHNPCEYARAVHQPTLLLSGGRDGWVRPTEIQHVYDNLAGPKRQVVFPDAGHEPYR